MFSLQAKMMNQIFRMMPKDASGQEHDYQKERMENERRKPPKTPKGVVVEKMEYGGFAGAVGNRIIFTMHGAGGRVPIA